VFLSFPYPMSRIIGLRFIGLTSLHSEFDFFSKQDATYTDDKDNFIHIQYYTFTGRKSSASEHQTRNPEIMSLMHTATLSFDVDKVTEN